MKKINRNQIIFILLLVIVLLIAGFLFTRKNKILIYNKSLIKIYRDDYGVPHISSNTDPGVLFGNGYAIAQDRLFQLEKNRRDAQGEMSEIYGRDYVDYDVSIRNTGYFHDEIIAQFDLLSDTDKSYFIAYKDGINAYINKVLENKKKLLPPEFVDLGIEPRKWTIADSVFIAQMIIRKYGENGGDEITNLKKLAELNHDIDLFNKLNPSVNPDAILSIPETETDKKINYNTNRSFSHVYPDVNWEILESIEDDKKFIEKTRDKLNLTTKLGSFMAIASPNKSITGHSILLAGPQMGHSEPSMIAEIKLKSPSFSVAGIQVPGIPGVIIGINNNISWAITSGAWSDNLDTYIEKINPDNKYQYWLDGQWQDMTVGSQEIKIKNDQSIDYEVIRTIHGPVTKWDLENDSAYTQKRSLWNNELNDIVSIININKSGNIDQFQQAIKNLSASLNFGYADKLGNIGYFHMGKYPIRNWDPRFPAIGDGSNEWQGFIDYIDLPKLINPQQNFIVNWNNKPIKSWTGKGEYTWIDTHAPEKIIALLDNNKKISPKNMADIIKQINDRGSYEQIVELSDPIKGVNILPPGQSGSSASEFFDDQKTMYDSFEYKNFNLWQ
jgi:penicillin amidase